MSYYPVLNYFLPSYLTISSGIIFFRYGIMHLCWSIDAAERPKFSDLVTTISGLLERDAGYLELSHKTDYSYLSQLTRSLSWKNKSGPSATTLDVQEEEMVDELKQEVVNAYSGISKC